MLFIRSLIGGLVIIIAAALVGIAQNAVRGNPMTLIPRVPKAAQQARDARTQPGRSEASTPGKEGAAGSVKEAEASADLSPEKLTADEIATGEIGMERVKAMIDAGTAVLIDARGEGEFAEGHLPGAINIPFEKFVDYYDTLVETIPVDARVIVYCRSVTCELSHDLANELKLIDYQNVFLYTGGWQDWTEAGYPVEE